MKDPNEPVFKRAVSNKFLTLSFTVYTKVVIMHIIQARRPVSQSREPFDSGKIPLDPAAHLLNLALGAAVFDKKTGIRDGPSDHDHERYAAGSSWKMFVPVYVQRAPS